MVDAVVCCTGSVGWTHFDWNVVRWFGIHGVRGLIVFAVQRTSSQCFRKVFLLLMLHMPWNSVRWVVLFFGCAWKSFCDRVAQSLSHHVRHPARSFDITLVGFRQAVHRTERINREDFSCFVRQRCCVGQTIIQWQITCHVSDDWIRNPLSGGLRRRPSHVCLEIIGLTFGLRPVVLMPTTVSETSTSTFYILMRFAWDKKVIFESVCRLRRGQTPDLSGKSWDCRSYVVEDLSDKSSGVPDVRSHTWPSLAS